MRRREHVTPRLGVLSLCIITATCFTVACIHQLFNFFWHDPPFVAEQLTKYSVAVIGCIYGLALAMSWVASAIPSRIACWLARIFIICVASLFNAMLSGEVWLHAAIDLSGLVLAQSFAFFAFKIPNWILAHQAATPPRRQFAIGDVVMATTAVAIILAGGARYQLTGIHPNDFWWIIILAWIACASIATLIASGLLQSLKVGSLRLAIAGALCYGCAYGLAFAEVSNGAPSKLFDDFFVLYLGIVGGMAATFSAAALAGRVQPSTESSADSLE